MDPCQQLPGTLGRKADARAQVGVLRLKGTQAFQARRIPPGSYRDFEYANSRLSAERTAPEAGQFLAEVPDQLFKLTKRGRLKRFLV